MLNEVVYRVTHGTVHGKTHSLGLTTVIEDAVWECARHANNVAKEYTITGYDSDMKLVEKYTWDMLNGLVSLPTTNDREEVDIFEEEEEFGETLDELEN